MSESKRSQDDSSSDSEQIESVYSPEYLRECASGDAREKRLEELKRRIELGAYRVDPDWVA